MHLPTKRRGETVISFFHCPSDQIEFDRINPTWEWPGANYVGVMGVGRNGNVKTMDTGHCGDKYLDGIFYPKSKVRIADIRDGTTNTIAMGEKYIEKRSLLKGCYWEGSDPDTKNCIFASKSARWPINSVPADGLNYDASPRTCLFNDLYFGSRHPGGANFVFADGSVHFLQEGIALDIYHDLATVNGGEINRWDE